MPRQFGGQEFRCRRPASDISQRRFALGEAGVLIIPAQKGLWSRLVSIGVEGERTGRTEPAVAAGIGPAGDDARQRRHILLRVTTADTKRVQLHDLAREIFVEATLA